jgi:hypothetical protein
MPLAFIPQASFTLTTPMNRSSKMPFGSRRLHVIRKRHCSIAGQSIAAQKASAINSFQLAEFLHGKTFFLFLHFVNLKPLLGASNDLPIWLQ